MRNRRWGIAIAAAVLIVVLVGAGIYFIKRNDQNHGADEKKMIELELVYAYQNTQWNGAIEKTVADFNAAHPEIRVIYKIHYENTVYENILNKLIARDELGDIVQVKTPKAYVSSGILGEISRDLVDKVGIHSCYVVEDAIYGVGAVNATNGIIYNKAIFDKYGLKEPKTYQEFLDLCSTLRARGITPVGVGGNDLWHMEHWVNHFFRSDILYQQEDWLLQCSRGERKWTDEEITVMLTHLTQLFSEGRVDANWRSTPDGNLAYMMSEGAIAMIFSNACTCEEILRLNPEMELGWFYIPDEKGEIQVGESRDTFWAVSRECMESREKYEAALTFLEFFYSEENYANVRKSIIAFPTIDRYADYEMNEIQTQIHKEFTENQIHIQGYIGNEDCPEGFESQMLVVIQRMLAGEIDVTTAQSRIQTLWDRCLEQEVGHEE